MDTPTKTLNASEAARLPRFDEYFGAWGIEPTRGLAMFEKMRSMDLQAHIVSTGTPRPAEKLKADMVPMPQIPPGQDVVNDDPNDLLDAPGGIALFNVTGVLMKQESSMGDSTSYVALRRQVRDAMADPKCVGGLLCIDSPGGAVAGCSDLMDDLKAFAAGKPLVAFAQDLAASCAYRIACAADEIYANSPECNVGSIGTFIGLYDTSEAAKAEGVRAKVYATGPLKGAGFPGAEITEAQDSYFQNIVNETQKFFAADVSMGREMSPESVAKVATGGCFMAKDAQSLGLIDGIKTYENCLARVSEMVSGSGAGIQKEAQMSTTQTAPAAPVIAAESKPTGKDYVAAFGPQGAMWFVEGKSFNDCIGLHRDQVEKEMTGLRQQVKDLTEENGKLHARVKELRGGDPVTSAIVPEAVKPAAKDIKSLEVKLGSPGLAAFARSLKLPTEKVPASN